MLFAQLASKWEKEPVAPPPFNLVGLPFVVWRFARKRFLSVQNAWYSEHLRPDLVPNEFIGWRSRYPTQNAVADHIDSFVQNHLGDLVSEDRWRLDLNQKLNQVLREQRVLAAQIAPNIRSRPISSRVGMRSKKQSATAGASGTRSELSV